MTDLHPIQIGRDLKTHTEIAAVARRHGLDVPHRGYHVTLAWSRDPVDWTRGVFMPEPGDLVCDPSNPRLELFGEGDLLALTFDCPILKARWAALTRAGASWDFPQFRPHITLGRVDPARVSTGAVLLYLPLHFGPEYRKPAKV